MIVSFGDPKTEDLYHGRSSSRVRHFPPDIARAALRKLDVLNSAHRLTDLVAPPGNRLEALHGNLQDFHSIRINSQWRIIFRWVNDSAYDVSVTDYH
jgi:proteic killer suppression protein